ncbi:MAG: protein-disulfide reductase DsbD N-terminal domain-containing protein [Sporocytophaga sp.]|nr:protein-disulfide reductase DsbD N-terminal domain-containing protein [Sporocytophaga sp.]
MKIRILIFFLMLGFSSSLIAQIEKPVIWSTAISKKEVKAGEIVELIFTAQIKSGWYLYSSDFDPNLGPNVTEIEIEKDPSFEVVGKLISVDSKKKYDSLWGGEYRYFKGTGVFKQKIKVLKDSPVIQVSLNAQACTDVSGKCVPVSGDFTFEGIKVTAGPAKETPVPANPKTPGKSTGALDKNSSVAELELEKSKLITRTPDGKDESIEVLKTFVRKWGN